MTSWLITAQLTPFIWPPLVHLVNQHPGQPSYRVVREWQKAGFRFGWFGETKSGEHEFRERPDGLARPLPAFYSIYAEWAPPHGAPVPSAPFALVLPAKEAKAAHLAWVGGLKGLAALELSVTELTDAGLKELAELKGLTVLDLALTKVTDAGVKALAGLKSLTFLYIEGSGVTEAGAQRLARALPRCDVFYPVRRP